MTESNKIINEIIKGYKENFTKIDEEERYKWQAIKIFKDNWDINSDSFEQIVEKSFVGMDNILRSRNYYPYKMLCDFAKQEPETVKSLFKTLYNENIDFEKRYKIFKDGFKNYFKPKGLNDYQDLHAISVYLTCEYPEKYYIYKYSVVKTIINLLEYDDVNIDALTDCEKINLVLKIYDDFLEYIKKDEELREMNKNRLGDDCYQDEYLHMMTQDIIFFASIKKEKYIKEKLTEMKKEFPKNLILYGPPGTGKTYNSIFWAVAIIENISIEEAYGDGSVERFKEIYDKYINYKKQGRIEFTTFHQSYGYEEFIEGIKPFVNSDDDENNISYKVVPGLFKEFCDKINVKNIVKNDYEFNDNPNIWKVSLEGTGNNQTRTECLENNHIRIGWDNYGEKISDETDFSKDGGKKPINAFINRMRIGDIVLSCYSATNIDAVGVVTGEYEWHDEYSQYKRVRNVNWIVKNINENIMEYTNGTTMTLSSVYRFSTISIENIQKIISKYSDKKEEKKYENKPYIFIIDEINRGNISKILGELITIIEPSKRIGCNEATEVRLPYSKQLFGVPENVYIIGTMNTADRSIAAIDTALRRRFSFKEMMPDINALYGIEVEGIIIDKLLEIMNKRIEALYDREHKIGHAYFIDLKENNSISNLAFIFKDKIIPLLQEYFYEDYEKIRLVLGDNQKNGNEEFINKEIINEQGLFGEDIEYIDEAYTYSINNEAFGKIGAYRFLQ